jgi:hypothetical protein
MAQPEKYVDLRGREFALADLDAEESQLVTNLLDRYHTSPAWNDFENYWTRAVAALYDGRGLARRESRQKAVYRLAQDLGNRLAIAAGLARAPDYRDELDEIVRTRFRTRRAFCEATGLAEDMLSHVLARRKHLSMEALTDALSRIGYAIHLVPRSEEVSSGGNGARENALG